MGQADGQVVMERGAGASWMRYLREDERQRAPEKVRLLATIAVVIALHVAGFGLVVLGAVAGSGKAVSFGMALTAYLAGLKHQADCDHISGIDNATRKFVGEGRRPVSIGLAFSLGHCSVVLLMAVAVIGGVRFTGTVLTEGSSVSAVLGTAGGVVAGTFLVLIGAFNLSTLRSLISSRRPSLGHRHTHDMGPGPVISRMMTKPLSRVRQPRHIFVIGFLFGIGFDTATLIGLLVLTGASAASGVGAVALLAFPLCFAAGMTLGDTANGIFMMRLYSSSTEGAERRIGFNILITAMSVTSALVIGTIILATTARSALNLADPVTRWLATLELENLGFGLIGIFLLVWAGSNIHRRLRLESESFSMLHRKLL